MMKIQIRNGVLKRLFLCVIFSFTISTTLFAKQEIYTDNLSGSNLSQNEVLTVSVTTPTSTVKAERIKNVITLRASGVVSATVDITVSYVIDGINHQEQKTLSVDYDNNTSQQKNVDRNSYIFKDASSVSITIGAVNVSAGLLDNLALENTIYAERIYDFDYTNVPSGLRYSSLPNSNEFLIEWGEVSGAEEYQLEWLSVNDYLLSENNSLSYDFRNNATRITTQGTSYNLSSVFEQGYVLLRVRAIGYFDLDKKSVVEGNWTCGDCRGSSAASFQDKIQITTPHSDDRLNWQYISNYAEGGKKKEVLTYFDGTLRTQQVVTKLNTDNTVIVGETFYDHQGRPAVQALPVPTQSQYLGFHKDFNRNSSEAVYNRNNFDVSVSENPCKVVANSMLNSSGASLYYSSENPDFNSTEPGFNRFIPDAASYPFSQTEYEPDNTGRIRRQGGVGETYQLNSGHETKYFYGKPSQEHLNRLFASEVGYNSHYQKNAVIDANGGTSVSYLDMQGRVIATALAGDAASGLQELESNTSEDGEQMTINLIDKNAPISTSGFYSSVFEHIVTKKGNYEFNYSLPRIRFINQGHLPEEVCMDCIYKITIDIVDECGKRPVLNGMTEQFPLVKTIGNTNPDCSSEGNALSFSFTLQNLDVGKYTISRILDINRSSFSEQKQKYISEDTSIISLSEFITKEKVKVDISSCFQKSCRDECLENIRASGGIITEAEIAQCMMSCEYQNPCDQAFDFMRSDFFPGQMLDNSLRFDTGNTTDLSGPQYMGGQYAAYVLDENENYLAPDDVTSIFHENNFETVKTLLGIEDPDNNKDIKWFVEHFESSWADILATEMHPERCKMQECRMNNNSSKYDFLMQNTDTYEEAYKLGLLNPLGIDGLFGLTGENAIPSQVDPYFDVRKNSSSEMYKYTDMKEFMLADTLTYNEESVIVNAWQKALFMAGVCKDETTLSELQTYQFAPLQNVDICSRDRVWEAFRALYLGEKQLRFSYIDNTAGTGCGGIIVGDKNLNNAYGNKEKRFLDVSDYFTDAQMQLLGDLSNVDAAIFDAEQLSAESQMLSMCESQAEIQVDDVLLQLSGCVLSNGTENNVWNDTNSDYLDLRGAFVNIMEKSCQLGEPLCTSSLPPNTVSEDGYNSFADAMIDILGAENLDMTCNPDLISKINSYGHFTPDITLFKIIDTCACNQIIASQKAYDLLTEKSLTAKEYFEEFYGYTLDNYNGKLCLCRRAFDAGRTPSVDWNSFVPWTEEGKGLLSSSVEYVPSGLSCSICSSCETVAALMDEYDSNSVSWLQNYDNTVNEQAYRNMLTNYLNNKLNLNQTYLDYEEFLMQCEAYSQTTTYPCNKISESGETLIDFIKSIFYRWTIADRICVGSDVILEEKFRSLLRYLDPQAFASSVSASGYLWEPEQQTDDSHLNVNFRDCGNNLLSDISFEFDNNTSGYQFKDIVRVLGDISIINEHELSINVLVAKGTKLEEVQLIVTTSSLVVSDCYSQDGPLMCNTPLNRKIEKESLCEKHFMDVAIMNAENLYDTYMDSVSISFENMYSQRCLSSTGTESFKMSYQDNEHHYTLYYYDQAGNLVRTIPPEGIEFVPNNLWPQIDLARQAGGTLFYPTSHRMETRYLYNSLNQLTAQYMPDHEAFEELSISKSVKGLPQDMLVNSTEFIDNMNGVLFGTNPTNTNQSLIYTTSDGGETWQLVSNIGVRNLTDVCVSGSDVHIVGEKGTYLRSRDGGSTWIPISPGTGENICSIQVYGNLGYLFTVSGKVFQTNDSGTSWNLLNNTGLEQIALLQSVYYANESTAWAVGESSNGMGSIYKTSNGGSSWQLQENLFPSDLDQVQMLNSRVGYSVGNSLFLKTTDGGSTWKQQSFWVANNERLKKIHFLSEQIGVGISSGNHLIVTKNGGLTWSRVNQNSAYGTSQIIDFSCYNQTYVYTLNSVGNMYKINLLNLFVDPNFPGNQINPEGSLHSICFIDDMHGYVGGTKSNLYFTKDGGTRWQKLQMPSAADSYDRLFVKRVNLDTVIVALKSDASLFVGKTNRLGTAVVSHVVDVPSSISSLNFIGNNGYLLSSSGAVYVSSDGGLTWENSTSTVSEDATCIGFVPSGNASSFVAVGKNGYMQKVSIGGSSLTPSVFSLPLNGISEKDGYVLAVGNGGSCLWQASGSNKFVLSTLPFSDQLLTSCVLGSKSVLIGGANGSVFRNDSYPNDAWAKILSSTGSSYLSMSVDENSKSAFLGTSLGSISKYSLTDNYTRTVLSSQASSSSIRSIALSGTSAFAVGDNGLIFKTNNIDGYQWQQQEGVQVELSQITGSASTPNGRLFVSTQSGAIFFSTDGGSSWFLSPTDGQSTPRLNDIYFFNDTYGMAVGDNGTVLRTTNGGSSWTSVSGSSVTDYQALCMTSTTRAFIVGKNGTVMLYNNQSNPLFTSLSVSGVSEQLNDVTVYGKIGFAVGTNGLVLKTEDITLSSPVWLVQQTPDHSSNWLNYLNKTGHLNAVYVEDAATAYIVCDGGVVLKSIDGGINWNIKDVKTTSRLTDISLKPDGTAVISGSGSTVVSLKDYSDGFSSRFWYDKLGRLVASQNSKQQSMPTPRYSYTSYDDLGRVVEVGELVSDVVPDEALLNHKSFPGNWSLDRRQVTKTRYDSPLSSIQPLFKDGQQHLRNRVATVAYFDVLPLAYSQGNSPLIHDWSGYNHATHYSYDIHGNVKEMIQDNPELELLGHRFKTLRYDYDLVSGNVNKVSYQAGEADQLYHTYEYDADNRITKVYTSLDGFNWDNDAAYQYYKHGPLARTELGDKKVQGVDYAYTLQGWLKGVNSNVLTPNNDMGEDGNNGFSKDAFGYSLHYNSSDYKAIGGSGSENFLAAVSSGDVTNLFNGNISRMATAISENVTGGSSLNLGTQVRDFKYDELNRLVSSKNVNTQTGKLTDVNAYATTYSYDANGNIKTLSRQDGAGLPMDNLTYRYAQDVHGNTFNNRLLHVNDDVSASDYDDIDDQGNFIQKNKATHNYVYDKIGNLVADKSEEISEIIWNVQGKVQAIKRTQGSEKPDLYFTYDAMGNRVSKCVVDKTPALDGVIKHTTYYVRDAQGNVMAVYENKEKENNTEEFFLLEQYLYGSSRLGMRKVNKLLAKTGENVDIDVSMSGRTLGEKQYELTNHLGNVLVVVSDKKLQDANGYKADVKSVSDYYPFGMAIPSRSFNSDKYRYGFNGMEKDDEIKGDGNSYATDNRIYDPRVGVWLSLDPLATKYLSLSPYNYCAGNPILFIDPSGTVLGTFDSRSLNRLYNEAKETFKDFPYIQNVIGMDRQRNQLSMNGLAFGKAMEMLNNDNRIDAEMKKTVAKVAMIYFQAIESKTNYKVELIYPDEVVSQGLYNAYQMKDVGPIEEQTGKDWDFGTEIDFNDNNNSAIILIVLDSKTQVKDYVSKSSQNKENGDSFSDKPKVKNTIVHELTHGFLRSIGIRDPKDRKQHVIPIQMDNAVSNMLNEDSYRSGSYHATGEKLSTEEANSLPKEVPLPKQIKE